MSNFSAISLREQVIFDEMIDDVPFGSNQIYEIGICSFSAKHTALRRKNQD
jgi:hypothetical protein